MAKRAVREGRECSFYRLDVHGHRTAQAPDCKAPLSELGARRVGELERVDLLKRGLVPAFLDPSDEGELLELTAHLAGRFFDHPEMLGGPLGQRFEAYQRLREPPHGRERRAQVVACEVNERGEAGQGVAENSLLPVEDPRDLLTHDLQASPAEIRIGLSRAGVTGVQKAIRLRYGDTEKLISAEIDCSVDLDPEQKGVHMSRFPELFEEAIDEVVIGEAFLVEELADHVARHIVERQRSLRAEVRITARYPVERVTPVTGLPTQEMVSLIGIAVASEGDVRRLVGVEATGINACPCAQGLVRGSAAERLLEAGFGDSDVERILELVPLATHNQRGRGTLYVGSDHQVNAERLVEIVEGSMSSPVYELLKRPDELFVVEHAHLQPRFVEDSVRFALKGILDVYPELEDGDFLHSRQLNMETIHNHDVVAERFGTVGEVRAELERGERLSRHTELREWLT